MALSKSGVEKIDCILFVFRYFYFSFFYKLLNSKGKITNTITQYELKLK